jgi:hypothetical protein
MARPDSGWRRTAAGYVRHLGRVRLRVEFMRWSGRWLAARENGGALFYAFWPFATAADAARHLERRAAAPEMALPEVRP